MTMVPVFMTVQRARRTRLPMRHVGPGRWIMWQPGTDRSWNVYDPHLWRKPRGYLRLVPRRSPPALRGFGQAEEIVEEAVEVSNGGPSPWPLIIAVGTVGFIGLGLLYGMARASGPGATRYRWGGV